MRQHAEERAKTHQSTPGELWRKTLKKMHYSSSIIKTAEHRLSRKNCTLNLNAILEEIHNIEKEKHMVTSTGANTDDTDLQSSDEELSLSDIQNTVSLNVDETVEKLQHELKMVELERDELQNLMTCKICLVNRIDTVFLTCRHFSTCQDCADRVRDCPVCRQIILGTVDVFIA